METDVSYVFINKKKSATILTSRLGNSFKTFTPLTCKDWTKTSNFSMTTITIKMTNEDDDHVATDDDAAAADDDYDMPVIRFWLNFKET